MGAVEGSYVVRVVTLVVWWIWIALMIVGSFIDFDHKLLPDFTTVGGMVLGVAYWAFVSVSFNNFAFDFANLDMYLRPAPALSTATRSPSTRARRPSSCSGSPTTRLPHAPLRTPDG